MFLHKLWQCENYISFPKILYFLIVTSFYIKKKKILIQVLKNFIFYKI